jgi:hypothetical protein
MNKQSIPPLIDFFKHIEDPRIKRNKVYPSSGILKAPAAQGIEAEIPQALQGGRGIGADSPVLPQSGRMRQKNSKNPPV